MQILIKMLISVRLLVNELYKKMIVLLGCYTVCALTCSRRFERL